MLQLTHKKLLNLAESIYMAIFKRRSGAIMEDFLSNLSWSSIGFVFNALTLFIVNTLAGRLLGPEGYGKYNLVLVFANLVSVFVLLGMQTVTVKFLSESDNEDDKRKFMSNSLMIVTANSFIFLVILGIIFSLNPFGVAIKNSIFLLMVAVFAIFLSYKALFESIAKGFNLFKMQSKVKIIESLIVIVAFVFFFYFLKLNSAYYYILSLIIGMLAFCIYLYVKISNLIVPWDQVYFKKTIRYSKNTIILLIISTLMSYADRLYVGRFLGMHDLGIYSAYLTSSTVFVGQIMLLLNNVFFPTIAAIKDKQAIRYQLDKVAIFSFLPIFVILSGISYLVISFFGKEFEKNIFLIAVFSFLAFLQLFGSLYLSLVLTQDTTYEKYKNLLYVLPIIVFLSYFLLWLFNFNSLSCAVLVYSIYIIYNFTIIRLSCNYAKNKIID